MDNTYNSKRMSKEDRRKQILEAATKVFVEKGYNGSTTAEIAKAADISEVTLFRYFSSKKEIFLEGIEPILLSTLETTISTAAELSVEEKLEHILYERIRLISINFEVVRLILMEASLLSELGSDSFMDRSLKILGNMLTQLDVAPEKREFILRMLMGSLLSFLFMPEKDEAAIKDYARKMAALISEMAKK